MRRRQEGDDKKRARVFRGMTEGEGEGMRIHAI